MPYSLAWLRFLGRLLVLLPLATGLSAGCIDKAPDADGAIDSSVADARSGDAAKAEADLAVLPQGPPLVLLGASGNYAILAKMEVSTVPTSAVTGDVGLSPAAASFITGFSMTRAGTYWTAPQVVGKLYAADNDPPTPINLTTAVANMLTAYTDAAGRPLPDFLNIGAGTVSGLTLTPGLYKWTSTVTIPTDITISGGANDVWIFQIAGDLTVSSAVKVTLVGGAKARNIFWQLSGVATLGSTSHFEGIILSKTAIVLKTGASVNGRLLAQTAVNLDGNAVTTPAP